MTKAKIRFYTDDILALIRKANAQVARNLAEAVAEEARKNVSRNDQVDTGFMRKAIYVKTRNYSGYEEAKLAAEAFTYSRRRNRRVLPKTQFAPEAELGDSAAAVGCAADYALVQELKDPFLYPALETVARNDAEAICQRVYREVIK